MASSVSHVSMANATSISSSVAPVDGLVGPAICATPPALLSIDPTTTFSLLLSPTNILYSTSRRRDTFPCQRIGKLPCFESACKSV